MAHLKKYKLGSVTNIINYIERRECDSICSDKSIDITKTHLNYNLAPKRKSDKVLQHIKIICQENNIIMLKRKDLNVMCSWIISKPQSILETEQALFFEETYKFVSSRYGIKNNDEYINILTATATFDTQTPFIHICFIPLKFKENKQRYTISSKEVITRYDLTTFHSDLSNYINKIFMRDVGIINNSTKVTLENLQEQIKQLKNKIEILESENKLLKSKFIDN